MSDEAITKQQRAARAAREVEESRARLLARGYVKRGPQELYAAARAETYPREAMQVPRKVTAYTYGEGPMMFLGQHIVRAMQDAGYPAEIVECYRPPERQDALYAKGRTAPGPKVTKARRWQSAHQFSEAVDIVHPSKGWDVSEVYWETLAACVRVVADRYGVKLDHGHNWRFRDSAHIELADWRFVQSRHLREVIERGEERPPNEAELWARFCEVLPEEAKQRQQRPGAPSGVDPFAWVRAVLERLGIR